MAPKRNPTSNAEKNTNEGKSYTRTHKERERNMIIINRLINIYSIGQNMFAFL